MVLKEWIHIVSVSRVQTKAEQYLKKKDIYVFIYRIIKIQEMTPDVYVVERKLGKITSFLNRLYKWTVAIFLLLRCNLPMLK